MTLTPLRAVMLLSLFAATALSHPAAAQTRSQEGRDKGVYKPAIWVDPDGCEHWVMDDGAEGYMTPHVTRDGIPVCRGANLCGNFGSDQLFATDSFRLSAAARGRLSAFFQDETAVAFIITGHTDSRASDAYNMRLSLNRARAVADVARQVGANVSEVRGFGERQPVASNGTADGRSKNRRVEIQCVR